MPDGVERRDRVRPGGGLRPGEHAAATSPGPNATARSAAARTARRTRRRRRPGRPRVAEQARPGAGRRFARGLLVVPVRPVERPRVAEPVVAVEPAEQHEVARRARRRPCRALARGVGWRAGWSSSPVPSDHSQVSARNCPPIPAEHHDPVERRIGRLCLYAALGRPGRGNRRAHDARGGAAGRGHGDQHGRAQRQDGETEHRDASRTSRWSAGDRWIAVRRRRRAGTFPGSGDGVTNRCDPRRPTRGSSPGRDRRALRPRAPAASCGGTRTARRPRRPRSAARRCRSRRRPTARR